VDGLKVSKVDRRDGLKLIFEGGSWILVRVSGTEPKIRLYVESRSPEEMRHLMHLVRQFFTQRRL
jgi:phosphomannomutase